MDQKRAGSETRTCAEKDGTRMKLGELALLLRNLRRHSPDLRQRPAMGLPNHAPGTGLFRPNALQFRGVNQTSTKSPRKWGKSK